MGAPMVRHLLRAGHTVWVWNRTRAKVDALVKDGARAVEERAGLAARVEALFLCVTDARAVEEVLFGTGGVLGEAGGAAAAARRLHTIVDHSTIAPSATRVLAQRAERAGVAWIDAPVSGGVPGAEAGTLAVMAGGGEQDLAQLAPVMAAYAARVTRMGEVGAGQTTKLCNQAIVCATVAAIAEAVGLAERAGIDAARLPEALAGGWADSVLLRTFVPRMTEAGHPAIGSLKTFQKDIDAVADAARESGAVMPVASTVQQVLRLGAAMGLGNADLAAFIDVVHPRGN